MEKQIDRMKRHFRKKKVVNLKDIQDVNNPRQQVRYLRLKGWIIANTDTFTYTYLGHVNPRKLKL